MERLLNAIKSQALALDSRTGQPRFGLVTSVDPARAMAKVQLQPDGLLTNWLPVLSAWIGTGWGMIALPSAGDQVLVVPQEGVAEHGVIIGAVFSAAQRPPTAAPGELRLVHRSGTSLTLSNDGTVRIQGDLHVDGEVYDRDGALGHLRGVYDTHTHRDSRGGTTSAPIQQDP